MQWLDVTYPVDEQLLIYPGDPVYERSFHASIKAGAACNVGKISLGCHTGTHMDAPFHFVDDGKTLDQVDLAQINGKVRVIEYKGSAQNIDRAFLENCHIQKGERVLFKTANAHRFAGKNLLTAYTALTLEAAKYLAEIGVLCVGVDYMTIEPAGSSGIVHRTILGAGIVAVESLDLRNIEAGDYEMCCLPLKLTGMDGSPVRALLRKIS